MNQVLDVVNPLIEKTFKIDLENEYSGLFDMSETSGKCEVTEKNCLQVMGIMEQNVGEIIYEKN